MQTEIKTENNKAIAQQFFKLVSEGNLEEIYNLLMAAG